MGSPGARALLRHRARHATAQHCLRAVEQVFGNQRLEVAGIGSMDVYRPNIDPVALVAIAAVTAVVGVAAAFVPARRAVRIDPLTALRHE